MVIFTSTHVQHSSQIGLSQSFVLFLDAFPCFSSVHEV